MIAKITRLYTVHYSDTGETVTYVDWIGTRGRKGRTEWPSDTNSEHAAALIERAWNDGCKHERETRG